jgi:transcription termination factor NusB
MINARVAEIKPTPSEVGPVYREIYKTSKPGARRLATAYATTLPTIDQHRQVFQSVALSRDAEERRTLIKGYRDAHQDQWIVHAIGQLPAAHGRALMKDYVLSPAGRKDNKALEEVWTYVANLGAEIRFGGQPAPDGEPDHDDAVVEFIEDVVDEVKEAIENVVEAVVGAFETLVEAIGAVVSWTVDKLTNLAQALLNANKTIFEILEAAVAYGYDFVRNMIAAIRNVGKAMFTILE